MYVTELKVITTHYCRYTATQFVLFVYLSSHFSLVPCLQDQGFITTEVLWTRTLVLAILRLCLISILTTRFDEINGFQSTVFGLL